MKKLKLIICCAFVAQICLAQDNIITKGKNYVNIYYGVNVFTSFYKAVASNASINLKTSTLGPIGLVYEHLVTEKIGIGVELGYSSYKLTYNDVTTDINGNLYTYDYTWNFSTIRAMGRANFHFANSDKFDAYGLVSAGYRTTTFSFSTNDPSGSKASFTGFIPFGIKPGIGFRYFFTPNVGINAELAIGTPIICGGLSFKF